MNKFPNVNVTVTAGRKNDREKTTTREPDYEEEEKNALHDFIRLAAPVSATIKHIETNLNTRRVSKQQYVKL